MDGCLYGFWGAVALWLAAEALLWLARRGKERDE